MLHSLNENIRELRTAHGMSQVEFANLVGVTKQCVSNWENDNVLPSIEMLTKIADAFNVSTDKLLGRESKDLLDVTGLTSEQIGHISLLVRDLKRCTHKNTAKDT